MTSRLNPEAAVFVPVSPTRLLMMDEAIISASPGVEIQIEIEQPTTAPLNIEYSGSPKQVDYFMRDNFSTIPNKIKELSNHASRTDPELTRNLHENMEHISIDQLLRIQSMKTSEENKELGKTSGMDSVLIEIDESTYNAETDKEVCDFPGLIKHLMNNTHIILPNDQDLTLQKKKKSVRNKYKKRGKKFQPNIIEHEGFITEHRKAPPIDLTFKPIQDFSNENPFGALQTVTTPNTTPMDDFYNFADFFKTPLQSPQKEEASCTPILNQEVITIETPLSFILSRSPVDDQVVPFEELKSPNEHPTFLHPPNANSIIFSTDLPRSPEPEDNFEVVFSQSLEDIQVSTKTEEKINFDTVKRDLIDLSGSKKKKKKKLTFSPDTKPFNKSLSSIDLHSSECFLRPEYTVRHPKKDRKNKNKNKLNTGSEKPVNVFNEQVSLNPIVKEQIVPAVDSLKAIPDDNCTSEPHSSKQTEAKNVTDNETSVKEVVQVIFEDDLSVGEPSVEIQETSFIHENAQETVSTVNKDVVSDQPLNLETPSCSNTNFDMKENHAQNHLDNSDNHEEAKKLTLELENEVPSSQESTPEDLRNLVKGFEVISSDDLIENSSPEEIMEDAELVEDEEFDKYHPIIRKEKAVYYDGDKEITFFVNVRKSISSEEVTVSDNDKSSDKNDMQLNDSYFADDIPNTKSVTTNSSENDIKETNIVSEEVSNEHSHLKQPIDFITNEQSIEEKPKQSTVNSHNQHREVEQSGYASEIQKNTETYNIVPEDENVLLAAKLEVPQTAEPETSASLSEGENNDQRKDDQLEERISKTVKETEYETQAKSSIGEESTNSKNTTDESDSAPDTQTVQPHNQDEPIPAPRLAIKTQEPSEKPTKEDKSTPLSPKTGKPAVSKPAPLSTASKASTPGIVSSKAMTTNVTTVKPSMTASKPTTSNAGPSKTTVSKPVSTAPSKPNASGIVTSKSTSTVITSAKSSTPSKLATTVASPKAASSSVASAKSATSTTTASKTTVAATKPTAASASSSKTVSSSAATSKPAVGSKPATNANATKPGVASSSASTTKPVTSSSASTTATVSTATPAKKPVASVAKPTGSKPATPSPTKPAVTSTTPSKSVPKQLPGLGDTTALKSSKPSSPTSNPASPTTSKSPVIKALISGIKAGEKSTLPAKSSVASKLIASKDKILEKKSPTTTDSKVPAKKIEALKSPVATVKPAAPTKTTVAAMKTVSSTKPPAPASTTNKATGTVPVTKPATPTSPVSGSTGVRKSPTTVVKTAEKSSKELSGTKPASPGKPAAAKSSGVKTEAKGITKTGEKSALGKKTEEGKKQEKSAQIQELKVTTTTT